MDVLSFGKFVLAVIKEARSIFTQRRKEKPGLVEVGTLLELYGSATRLAGFAEAINPLLTDISNEVNDNDKQRIRAFLKEIQSFIGLVRKLNTCVIDIYYPQLSRAILGLHYSDMEVCRVHDERLRLNFDVPPKEIANIWKSLDPPHPLEKQAWSLMDNIRRLERGSMNVEELRQPLRELSSLAIQCRNTIGEIVRESWDFKEFQSSDLVP